MEFLTTATVEDSLRAQTVDDLNRLARLVPGMAIGGRKEDLVARVSRGLKDEQTLRELWQQLDSTEKKAVSETLYSSGGFLNFTRFHARYGTLPAFTLGDGKGYRQSPALLCVFIHKAPGGPSFIPSDLRDLLARFVPEPEPLRLPDLEELPQCFKRIEEESVYSAPSRDVGQTRDRSSNVLTTPPRTVRNIVHETALQRRDTERDALQDVMTLLRLVEKGRVAVSDKTSQPSSAVMKEISVLLRGGDFYAPEEDLNGDEQSIGPIKPFAWPLLLQSARLTELNGKKLALTKTGRAALRRPAAQTIKLLWDRWAEAGLIDEFNRIDTIKGQQGGGKRHMTSPAKRRKTVAKALAECPVGRWIEFNEFSRFMRAAGHRFEVAHDPWQLYIGHREYGCLGYDGYGGWNVLQDRQMLCFLFEYAATLGIIDVAFISPRMARDDFRDMWGTDDLDFLSRYDGLCYFRLNPLGAFCLGSIDHYTPSQPEARVRLNVMSNLQIEVDGALSPEEELLLENYADRESGAMWRLSRERTLSTLEGGAAIAELRSFLEARDDQELPDPVSAFLVLTERNATALKPKCRTLLIECADIEVVDLLTTHERSKKLCLRAGERLLVVKENDEAAFRKVAHMLGYGIPRSEV